LEKGLRKTGFSKNLLGNPSKIKDFAGLAKPRVLQGVLSKSAFGKQTVSLKPKEKAVN